MSSADVIELGSSDEEAEPVPKRKKTSPNVMVNIPPNLKEVTIKPTKKGQRINPVSLGKGVTVTRIPKNTVTRIPKNTVTSNAFTNKSKFNGKTVPPQTKQVPVPRILSIPIKAKKATTTATINSQLIPIVNRHITQSQSKVPIGMSPAKNVFNPVRIMNLPKQTIRPVGKINIIHSPGQKNLPPMTKLPAGLIITKKKTANSHGPAVSHGSKPVTYNNIKSPRKLTPREVMTVDLDDDEPQTSTASGPQWYLRPEDQDKSQQSEKNEEKSSEQVTETFENSKSPDRTEESQNKSTEEENQSGIQGDPNSLEEANNKEPDKANFIEITIEDSPIKPITSKKGFKVGAELAITIDDSPVKHTADKTPVGSDEDEMEKVIHPHRRKKLKYPKEAQHNVIEIEIEPFQAELNPAKEIEVAIQPETTQVLNNIIEIEESPIKTLETKDTTPKKSQKVPVQVTKLEHLNDKEKEEFHPAYQAFIKLCFQLENSDDMKKIVEKKIMSYYRQVPRDYTESEMFIEMVLSKTAAMKAAPEKMYLYIKDIVDELDVQRKMAKKQAEERKEEQDKFLYGEESEFDTKRQRQIRKLEKTLKKLHRAIQKLEEQEVDFDDEEDSVYLLTERYKERMVRVHAKLCQLTNTKMPSEPRIQIDARPGQPKGPAKRLEKWINKKVPIGTPLPFPDFHDVLRCVRDANQQDKLGWNEADIMEEARDLFTRCGKKLQRRRQENEWRLAALRLHNDGDPAENSEDLKRKLEENNRVAAKRETEVLNKYADRQKHLKLEAEEIGDKEVDESPDESDEEEFEDNGSLENKQRRKKRLKRLLQEKSRRNSYKKEDIEEPSVQEEDKFEDEGTNIDNDNEKNDQTKDGEPPAKRAKFEETAGSAETSDHKDEKPENGEEDGDKSDKIHSLSDDSSKIESDIDELHLLQKLHSENEVNSSTLESDSESPIDISDESSSSDLCKNKRSSDVISIENSSYSESEDKKDVYERGLLVITEIEEDNDSSREKDRPTDVNDSRSEDTVRADSPDTIEGNKSEIYLDTETCTNLRDDNISIDETEIFVASGSPKNPLDTENNLIDNISINSSPEENKDGNDINNEVDSGTATCINLRDDNISIEENDLLPNSIDDGNNSKANEITNDDNLGETCENLIANNIISTDNKKIESNSLNLAKEDIVNTCEDKIIQSARLDDPTNDTYTTDTIGSMEVCKEIENNSEGKRIDIKASEVTEKLTKDDFVISGERNNEDTNKAKHCITKECENDTNKMDTTEKTDVGNEGNIPSEMMEVDLNGM